MFSLQLLLKTFLLRQILREWRTSYIPNARRNSHKVLVTVSRF
jgi:hypothetical protein